MLYHGLRVMPYSLCSMVAVMKAVAECPDGNEWRFDPSGRITLTVCFRVLTAIAISEAENASETSIRPQELLPCMPPIFSPSMAMAGAYCR